MAKPTILKIPEEVLEAILKECRTWYHPSVKNKDAAPIDFGTYSDFHLRLDYVKYLPVLLTCRTFLRIASPLAYECVSLVSPVLHGQKRRPSFPEYYTMLPRRDSGRVYSSLSDQLHITIINLSPQGIERSLTTLTCQSRPKIAGSCRALSIDPRLPVTPSQTLVLSKVYSEDTLASLTTVRSLDYTLASPSGVFDLSHVDWTTDDSVQWQLKFFQNAVTHLPRVKRLRLAFVRERLCPSIWNGLVELLAQVNDLQVMCLSHMRSLTEQRGPHAAPGNPFADEVLQSPKHTARFTTLILNNYGRCYKTLEYLIRWPRRLEHFSFTLRFGLESLYLNDIHMRDGPMAGQIVQKLHDMLEPHRTTLKSLRIGLALTPVAFAMAYMPGLDYPAGANFGLDHGIIPDFRDYRNLQHLHIASIFTGHQDFCDRWRFRSESRDLDELHRDVDRLLAPTLYRITLDVGCEFSLRHCPCFPLDIKDQPVCDLLCPLDQDLFAFLITLARRAKYRRARLCQIHVNYCVRPFALPMPVSDLPEGFDREWIPQYHYFDPWEWLERVKRRVERLGILFTYNGLEPVCGVPRTHIPIPEIPFDMSVAEWLQLCRQHHLQLFNYEDEMCSEHVWTVVKSG